MKASIVIPNLNGAEWLKGSIESLYDQTEQDFELIVVDNGSTDQSLIDAREFADTKNNFKLIENKENLGFSVAVNQGIRLAKSPYVLLFNNDAFAEPDMLENLLQDMQGNPDAFSVQCHMLRHLDPGKTDDAGDFVTIFGWAFKRGDGLPEELYTKPRRIFSSCGGAAMYRKSVLDKIGLFEENFFAYLEDVDISWRANSLGYKNLFCPKARCSHICGATTSGKTGAKYNDFKSVQSGRNSLLLPYKNMPIIMLILNFPFLLLGYIVKTIVFHLRGFGKPWRKGMKEGFALIGKLDKPRFKLKNIPNYIWVQFSLIGGTFGYINYRVRRMFVK